MNLVSSSANRVSANTHPAINARIHRQTDMHIAKAARGGRHEVDKRLAELDREWDVERCLETGASSLMLLGLTLGSTVSKRWLLLPAGVAAFLLQHAIQGWCPPLPLLRRLGVRTADEINRERQALRALKGELQSPYPHTQNPIANAISIAS